MGLPILLYIFLARLRLFILIIQSDCEINMRERLKHEKKKKMLAPQLHTVPRKNGHRIPSQRPGHL